MAKKRQRSEKGTVSIGSKGNMLRLRWRYDGERFDKSPGLRDVPVNRVKARELASQIERDIALGQFDRTCDKYFPRHHATESAKPLTTIEQWDRWMKKQHDEGVSPQTLANRYQTIRNLLTHFQRDILTEEDAQEFRDWLHQKRQKGETVNRNLKMLQAFSKWALEQDFQKVDPFLSIKPVKVKHSQTENRQPFTLEELERILETMRSHPFHAHYFDFTFTLMCLGLRPSEAIGLRWMHLDLARGEIIISESLSRSGEGNKRVRKERKNGEVTVLPLETGLLSVFQARLRLTPGAKPDDLIFRTPRGGVINDRNYCQRVWKPVLELASVPYRPPYNLRHSFASHAIEQGFDYPTVAYLLGHRNTRMVSQVYGHMVNRPKLPKLNR